MWRTALYPTRVELMLEHEVEMKVAAAHSVFSHVHVHVEQGWKCVAVLIRSVVDGACKWGQLSLVQERTFEDCVQCTLSFEPYPAATINQQIHYM